MCIFSYQLPQSVGKGGFRVIPLIDRNFVSYLLLNVFISLNFLTPLIRPLIIKTLYPKLTEAPMSDLGKGGGMEIQNTFLECQIFPC